MAKTSNTTKKSTTEKSGTTARKPRTTAQKAGTAMEQPRMLDGAMQSALQEFFVTALQEIYWSERNLVNVLNSMAGAATTEQLRGSFQTHREQTQTHVSRLEEVFNMLGMEPGEKHCVGLQGLFDEGWKVIDETEPGSAQRDVALIIAAQKVEHYEMACYGSMVSLARTLNRRDISELLIETLTEEKETDALLTSIAETSINYQASREMVSDM
jgi:ferritin-like metal-binding protein YciE